MRADELFTLPDAFPFAAHFKPEARPWEWVKAIAGALRDILPDMGGAMVGFDAVPNGLEIHGDVHIHPGVRLPRFGTILGPAYIGPGTELRPGVYIRGNVIVAGGAVLGNSCEFKNCLLLEGVQAPHFNYVGDSVLGRKAHLGAGAILSNLRFDGRPVGVRTPEGMADSGMRKLGAMLGDEAEIGCNVVLQPGTVLGKRALISPGVAFGGYLEAGTIAFWKPNIHTVARERLERE